MVFICEIGNKKKLVGIFPSCSSPSAESISVPEANVYHPEDRVQA